MYQPDIPQNVGAMMRLAACTGVELHIIEPCGFPWNERKIRQSGMDYVDSMEYSRHESWAKFLEIRPGGGLFCLHQGGGTVLQL
jgi:tRNA (cytidine/uridine-2'-O-)-methyltransferase